MYFLRWTSSNVRRCSCGAIRNKWTYPTVYNSVFFSTWSSWNCLTKVVLKAFVFTLYFKCSCPVVKAVKHSSVILCLGVFMPYIPFRLGDAYTWWRHRMETFPSYWPFVRGIDRSPMGSLTKASDAKLWCFLWCVPEQTVAHTAEMPVISDAISLIVAIIGSGIYTAPSHYLNSGRHIFNQTPRNKLQWNIRQDMKNFIKIYLKMSSTKSTL